MNFFVGVSFNCFDMLPAVDFMSGSSFSVDIYFAVRDNVELIEPSYSFVWGKKELFELFGNVLLHLARPIANEEETSLYDVEMIDIIDF